MISADPWASLRRNPFILDLSTLAIPSIFLNPSPELASPQVVVDELRASWKSLVEIGIFIRQVLDRKGFLLARNLALPREPGPALDAVFLAVAASVGTPVSHTIDGSAYIWDITPKTAGSRVPTYSEHNGEAPLHTDSSYRKLPENYIANLMIRPAGDGGGTTTLLDGRIVIDEMARSAEGRACLEVLATTLFPILVPTVFRTQAHADIEMIHASVLSTKPLLRFRIDSMLDAIKHSGADAGTKARYLNYFFRVACESESLLRLRLLERDMLFLNNHLVMHGRTAFTDIRRLMKRIRMD
jgi:alpha-ketoglutarate-dependent taurine dioxygenase